MIDAILDGLLKTTAPEAVSVVFGLMYSILAVVRTRWCWVAGGISSGILIVLSWQARLPMQALLQAYYVGMAVYGFWHWSREDKAKAEVTTWPLRVASHRAGRDRRAERGVFEIPRQSDDRRRGPSSIRSSPGAVCWRRG